MDQVTPKDISPYAIPGVAPRTLPHFTEAVGQYAFQKICEHYNIKPLALRAYRGPYPAPYIRHMLIYCLNELYGNSITLKGYGAVLGGKDHTTIIYGLQRMQNAIDTNELTQLGLDTPAINVPEDHLLTLKYLKKCLQEYQGK